MCVSVSLPDGENLRCLVFLTLSSNTLPVTQLPFSLTVIIISRANLSENDLFHESWNK